MGFDKRLLAQAGSVRRYIGLVGSLTVGATLLTIAQAYSLAIIIDQVFLAHQELATVAGWLIALLAIMAGRAVLQWLTEIAVGKLARHAKTALREQLFQHLLKLGPAYTKGERSGELSSTLTDGVEGIEPYLGQYLPQVIIIAITPPIILVVVGWTDWLSGLVLLLTAPLLPLFMALIGWLTKAESEKQWRSMGLMSAHFLDILQGLTTLKLFGRSRAQQVIIGEISDRFRRATMRVLRIAFLSSLVLELGATLSTAIVAVEIGLRLLYNGIAFQPAFFVLLLAPEFYLPLRVLGARYHAGQVGSAASKRIFEILQTPVPQATNVTGKVEASWYETARLQGIAVNFENVSFTYPHTQKPALQRMSFTLAPGAQTALVGTSGSGKSTVAALLLGFVEINSGQITINGLPLTTLDPDGWRKLIAWVPQHPYLFNASVAENIRLGQPAASLADIEWAAQQAQASDFIAALPQAYDTIIGERGCRLSGGQAQRISLARAFLKNAPLLILDEATANLDPQTEQAVVVAISQLSAGRTVLTIAHRLTPIEQADRRLILENGSLVEQSTETPPEELYLCQVAA